MPPRKRTDHWPCPIARAADLVGDSWTVLILRDSFAGVRRFEDFQRSLGAPRSVLTTRLQQLVDDGMLARVRYQDRPPRHEYRLTEKGRSFWGVLAAMWQWGDDWAFTDGAPIEMVTADDGAAIVPLVVDANTGEPLDVRNIMIRTKKR